MKTSVKSRMDLAVDLGVEFACRGLRQAAALSSPTVAILGELLLGRTQPFFLLHLALVSMASLSPHITVTIQLPGLRLARNKI